MGLYQGWHADIILYNSERVCDLELAGMSEHISKFLTEMPQYDFRILSSLSLEPRYKHQELPVIAIQTLPHSLFDGRLPRLRALSLSSVAFPWQSLRGLESLSLSDCTNSSTTLPLHLGDLLESLAECPRLRDLTLHDIPPPVPERHYPEVVLPDLGRMRLYEDVALCAILLSHLRIPTRTNLHLFTSGLLQSEDARDVLVPISAHLQSAGTHKPRFIRIERSLSHCKLALFIDTTLPDIMDYDSPRCVFVLNSHPSSEEELLLILTEVLNAVPLECITHFDARLAPTLGEASWSTIMQLLPALDYIYVQIPAGAIECLNGLLHAEPMESRIYKLPRIRHLHMRVVRDTQELTNVTAEVEAMLPVLEKYMSVRLTNGNPVETLGLDDQHQVLEDKEDSIERMYTSEQQHLKLSGGVASLADLSGVCTKIDMKLPALPWGIVWNTQISMSYHIPTSLRLVDTEPVPLVQPMKHCLVFGKDFPPDPFRGIPRLFHLLRKSSILTANTQAVLTHGKAISSSTIALSRKLGEPLKASAQSTAKLRTEAKQFEAKELEALAGHSERIDQQLKRVEAALAVVHAKDAAEAEALAVVQSTLKETHESFRVGFAAWAGTLKRSCETTCGQANEVGLEAFATVEKALKAMGSAVESVVREACAFVDSERALVTETKELAASTSAAEITRLRTQNQLLARMLEEERLRGDKAKDELLQRVSGLLGEFTKERDRGLREAVGIVQAANVKAEEGMKVFEREHGDLAEAMEVKGKEVARGVEKWGADAKRTRDGALSKTQLSSELASLQYTVSGSIQSYSAEVQTQMQNIEYGKLHLYFLCSADGYLPLDHSAQSTRGRLLMVLHLGGAL
ncbi:hypothetical protein K438DRAFT_2068028 [Mycena galopus ATCC 62051]|nr:hypothetical protein K438DRAFT_2068028 [Mycena galopus ATCC 62051]